jgi:hypothetical protein
VNHDASQARRAALIALKIDLQHRRSLAPDDPQTWIDLERVKTELACLRQGARNSIAVPKHKEVISKC